ncbi:uncharacterized protein LOC135817389 [Sycon ciliatum]|uniref:uncharacterized protein LOC135817389 n=1 Tax=Sycon ciliatum TaxID=27933 RepID=UPI0031F7109F
MNDHPRGQLHMAASVLIGVLCLSFLVPIRGQVPQVDTGLSATSTIACNATSTDTGIAWFGVLYLHQTGAASSFADYTFQIIGGFLSDTSSAAFYGPGFGNVNGSLHSIYDESDPPAGGASSPSITGQWLTISATDVVLFYAGLVQVHVQLIDNVTLNGSCQFVSGQGQAPAITGLNQHICDKANTNLLPITWCHYQNPYVSVLPVSDVLYSSDSCFGIECTVKDNTGIPYNCYLNGERDYQHPHSVCVGVMRFTAFESYTNRYSTVTPSRDVHNRTLYPYPFVFTVMGLETGRMVANVVNNLAHAVGDSQFLYGQQNIMVRQAHRFSVEHLVSLGFTNNAALDTVGLVASSDNITTQLVYLNMDVWPPTGINICLDLQHTRNGEELVSLHLWESTADNHTAVLSVLVRKFNTFVYELQHYSFDFSKSFENCPSPTTVKWTISAEQELLGVAIVRHYVNLTNPFLFTEIDRPRLQTVRTLALLYDGKQCNVFQLEGKGVHLQSTAVSMAACHPESCFFTAGSGEYIQAADLFGEFLQRVKNSSLHVSTAMFIDPKYDSYLQPSQLMWLAIAVSNGSGQAVKVVSLNEFGYFSAPLSAALATNPAQRSDLCGISSWLDPSNGQCVPRRIYTQGLPRPVVMIQTRFRSVDLSNLQGDSAAKSFSQQPVQNQIGSFLYSVFFVQLQPDDDVLYDSVVLLGAQAQLGSADDVEFVQLNEVSYIGSVLSLFASPNSFHMVVTVKRHLFNVQSLTRLIQTCRTLVYLQKNSPEKLVLLPIAQYSQLCSQPNYLALLNRGPPNINDFTWYTSSCVSGSYCPSMVSANISQVHAGLYTLRSFEVHVCEQGYFCTGGRRITCPPGFKCPSTQMTSPLRCSVNMDYNTTCYQLTIDGAPGVISEIPCTDGSICPVPFMPSVQAPPGYKANNDPNTTSQELFLECKAGDWCSLGAAAYNASSGNASDLRCPKAHYCSTPDVFEPTMCNFSQNGGFYYCPPGTAEQQLCPAGYYCSGPFNITYCPPHQYCPVGKAVEGPCPGSYYCPNSSVRIQCPSGHYCKPGTVTPISCPILTSCPPGTESEKNSGLAIVLVFLPASFIIGAWWLFLRHRDKERVARHQKRRTRYQSLAAEHDSPDHQGETSSSNGSELTRSLISGSGYRYSSNGATASGDDNYMDISLVKKADEPKFTIDFQFDELGLELKSSGAKVLQGVTGQIKSHQVTAVMGPSGAGKSTFITTLCGKATYGRQTGRVFINDSPDDLTRYRKVVGFVPQDDIMLRMMTVKENLTFHAMMRLPRSMPRVAKREKVQNVIDDLGLYDIRHSVIGDETKRGISGGQRKRVNIGMEMVANPTVLFLDEPTSGLDSTSSKEVCACLKRIAESGLTVVTVIHQPRYEIFKMFHSVLLLGKGGRTVYLGPSEKALPYFQGLGFQCPEHANPPDFFMDVISGDVARSGHPEFTSVDLFDLWTDHTDGSSAQGKTPRAKPGAVPGQSRLQPMDIEDSPDSEPISTRQPSVPASEAEEARKRKTAGFAKQLYYFTLRALLQFSRDWQGILFDFILVLISGLFLGMVYFQVFYVGPAPPTVVAQCPQALLEASPSPCLVPRNDPLPGQSCVASLALALAAVSGSLRVFGAERTNFWRESSTGVSTLAYYLGKSIAHMPTIVIAPFMFLILYYQLVTPLADMAGYYLICWLVYWTAAGYGYLISIIVPPSMAQLFAVLSVLFNMMFSGALPRFEQLQKILGGVLMYPTYISYIRWSQEAFYLHEIAKYKDIYHNVEAGMEIYQYKFSHQSLDLGMIFVLGVIVRIIAYLALELMYRGKRK